MTKFTIGWIGGIATGAFLTGFILHRQQADLGVLITLFIIGVFLYLLTVWVANTAGRS